MATGAQADCEGPRELGRHGEANAPERVLVSLAKIPLPFFIKFDRAESGETPPNRQRRYMINTAFQDGWDGQNIEMLNPSTEAHLSSFYEGLYENQQLEWDLL